MQIIACQVFCPIMGLRRAQYDFTASLLIIERSVFVVRTGR